MVHEQGKKMLIDRVTPLQEPSEQQVSQWARSQSVFVSSTMVDLGAARKAAETEIRRVGARPVMFESFGARTDDSGDAFLAEVRRSTVYIGILSQRYGARLPSGYSATQEEYEEARKERKEILLFLDNALPDTEREGHLNRWINELYQFHVLGKYEGLDGLAQAIRTSLTHLAGVQLTPWVKLGHLVFQATKIVRQTQGGRTTVEITTVCRDPHIRAELGDVASQPFSPPVQQLTYLLNSLPVTIASVVETIHPSGADSLIVTCEVAERRDALQGGDSLLRMGGSYQSGSKTYSHEDLVMIAARAVVLGEEPPQDPFLRVADTTDFRSLFSVCGSDPNVFPQVCRLLAVEKLLGRGMVGHLLDLSYASIRRRQMRVRMAATLPQLYGNQDSKRIELEGIVEL